MYAGIHVTPTKITRADVFTVSFPAFNEAQQAATTAFREGLEADSFTVVTDETEIDEVEDLAKLGDFTQLTIENGVLVTEIQPAA